MRLKGRAWSKQRFLCAGCGITFVLGDRPAISREMRLITKESLERGSMRILGRRFGKNKSTIMKIVHDVTASLKDSLWIAKRFSPSWSGLLIVDGKYIHTYDRLATMISASGPKRAKACGLRAKVFSADELKHMHKSVFLCGIDAGTGDLPHYELAEEESKIDLIIYFRKLKEIGYPLRVLICDGNDDIVLAARHVFGQTFLVQRCTRHFVEGCKRKTREADQLDNPRVIKLIAMIQTVIEAQGLQEAEQRLIALKQIPVHGRLESLLIEDFKARVGELTTHLIHPELRIPHTSNEIENLFHQLELRLESLGRFGHRAYAAHYLNAWALMRRFTPFTDCRGAKRRQRNKHSPLELAGCDVVGMDYLKLK